MFLRPTSPFKRLAAILIGLIWTLIGGAWTYYNANSPSHDDDHTAQVFATFILLAGLALIASALRPSRPPHIEAETPDLHEGFTEHVWRD